jgi:voltage-gated potassium channel
MRGVATAMDSMKSRLTVLSTAAEPFFKKTEFLLMALGFFYLGIYSVEVLAEPPAETLAVLNIASTVIYVVFLLDLLARFVFQVPYLGKLSAWISFVKVNWLSILATLVPAFRSLRVLRVLMVLRGIAPYMVTRTHKVGMIVAVSLPLVLYTAAISVFEAERYAEGSNIQSFGDALWWSLVSVTTVGYGDSFPITAEGRAVAGLLMFVGIGLFSSLTALLAAWVVEGAGKNNSAR